MIARKRGPQRGIVGTAARKTSRDLVDMRLFGGRGGIEPPQRGESRD